MRNLALFAVLATAILVCGCGRQSQKPYNEGINIIPTPVELTRHAGAFTLKRSTSISADSSLDIVADYFSAKMSRATGYAFDRGVAASDVIRMVVDTTLDVPSPEGYTLEVSPEAVTVTGKSAQGLFYGMQTFLQLLPAEIESPARVGGMEWTAPSVTVRDYPRFAYRGMMLDVTRHYNDVDFIKKQLDVLAMFKINRFHWHLTDDQLWAVEIKKYPELTRIGSVRHEQDGTVHEGYFTQEQIKEVVAYAGERFIEVIPEIELPGHALASLSAYPQYSCTGGPFTHRLVWGVEPDIFCAGKDETFAFLEDILTEIAALFPGRYIHIGGDECPRDRWMECSDCRARMKSEGLGSPAELQSYFVRRIEKHVNSLGKQIIGWDEILEGGIDPSATILSWRGTEGGVEAARSGHDVIMAPGEWLYIDKYQGAPEVEPVSIGGYLPLEKVYSFDPMPEGLTPEEESHVIGAQANVWTEYMYEPGAPEYFIYPRILAVAEITWSPASRKDYADFSRRIDGALVRLDGHGIGYHVPMPEGPLSDRMVFVDSIVLGFGNTRDYPMVYTVDGTVPDVNSDIYTDSLRFTDNTSLKIATLLPSGKTGRVREIEIVREALSPASDASTEPGVVSRTARGLFIDTVAMKDAEWSEPQIVDGFMKGRVESLDYKNPGVTVYEGFFEVPVDGVYTVFTDQYLLYVDGKPLIVNDGVIAIRHGLNKKTMALEAGRHKFVLVVNNRIVGGWPYTWSHATFYYIAPGTDKPIDIRRTELSH